MIICNDTLLNQETLMKLYNSKLSPYSARVRAQIYAKGLDVELIDPPGGGVHSPEYAKLNPMERVPTLDDNGFLLPESITIMEYLEDRFPNPSLRPEDPKARAKARLLARLADVYVMGALTKLFANVNPATRDAAVAELGMHEMDKALQHLEHFLEGGHTYAVGGRLSLADCTLATGLFFIDKVAPAFGSKAPYALAPKVKAYMAAIQADPAIAKVTKEQTEALIARMAQPS